MFAALSPSDVNKLSYEVVQVFQGEGTTIEGLLTSTSSLTQTLASRDKVIGALITNLNDVLATLSGRDSELSTLIIRLREFVCGLKGDRQAILGSLNSISDLSQQTAEPGRRGAAAAHLGREEPAPGHQEPQRQPAARSTGR